MGETTNAYCYSLHNGMHSRITWVIFSVLYSDFKHLFRGLSIIWSVSKPYDLTTHNPRIGSVTWSPFENIFKSQFTSLTSHLYYSHQRNLIIPSLEDRNHKKKQHTNYI